MNHLRPYSVPPAPAPRRATYLRCFCICALGTPFLSTPVLGQQAGGGGGAILHIDQSIPAVLSPPRTGALELRLQGQFPPMGSTSPSLMVITVENGDSRCEVGWEPDVLTHLVGHSEMPWLTESDLVDPASNERKLGCGSIASIDTSHVTLRVEDRSMMAAGEIQVLITTVADGTAVQERTAFTIPINEEMLLVGQTPRSLVLLPDRDARVHFAFSGSKPTWARAILPSREVTLDIRVTGGRVEVALPASLFSPPPPSVARPERGSLSEALPVAGDEIVIHLGNSARSVVARVPFCITDLRQLAACSR